jgi:predicted methyltransferase
MFGHGLAPLVVDWFGARTLNRADRCRSAAENFGNDRKLVSGCRPTRFQASIICRKTNADQRVPRDGWRGHCFGNRRRPQITKGDPMRFTTLVAASLALTAIAPLGAKPAPISTTIAAAMASPDRRPDNVKIDEGRKPAQVLEFLGLRPGMNVLDLFGANGYWAELMVPAIGSKGHDTIWQPTQFYNDKAKTYATGFAAKHPNVTVITSPFEAPDLPRNYADFVILNDNYHDTYWKSDKNKIPQMDPNAFLKAVYAAMKPGAVIGVIDHVANPNNDTRATVDKFHRIDPNVVKADFKRAGFVLLGSSDLLRNPADDHNLLVFDPKVAGHTDRFIFKFKKPR